MTKFTLRRAKPEDAKPLSDCIDAAYSVYASRIPDLPSVSDGIAQSIENNLVWVAESEAEVIGGIILVPHENFMMLENVAVHSNSAGLGVGGALIKQAEAECLEHGLHQLRLSTHVDMPENIELYQHLGWQVKGRSGNKVQMSKAI